MPLSAVYFQTYQMALDYAKAAQRALQFEMGWPEDEVAYIGSSYWDSLKRGLLSGERLTLDLDRLEKAPCPRSIGRGCSTSLTTSRRSGRPSCSTRAGG